MKFEHVVVMKKHNAARKIARLLLDFYLRSSEMFAVHKVRFLRFILTAMCLIGLGKNASAVVSCGFGSNVSMPQVTVSAGMADGTLIGAAVVQSVAACQSGSISTDKNTAMSVLLDLSTYSTGGLAPQKSPYQPNATLVPVSSGLWIQVTPTASAPVTVAQTDSVGSIQWNAQFSGIAKTPNLGSVTYQYIKHGRMVQAGSSLSAGTQVSLPVRITAASGDFQSTTGPSLGAIVSQSCGMRLANQSVQLGTINTNTFNGVGSVSTPAKNFSLLLDCGGNYPSTLALQFDSSYKSSSQAGVLTLDNSSTAQGVGIQVYGDSSLPLNFGTLYNLSTAQIQNGSFPMSAAFIALSSSINAGQVSTSFTVTISFP